MSKVFKEYEPSEVRLSWTISGKEFVAVNCKEELITLEAGVAPLKEDGVGDDTVSLEVRYCVIGAGSVGHPQKVFNKVCEERVWNVTHQKRCSTHTLVIVGVIVCGL